MAKNCPKCNHENLDDAHYCNKCGYRFGNSSKSSTKEYSKIFMFLIIVIVIAVCAVVLNFGLNVNQTTADVPLSSNVTDSDTFNVIISNVDGFSSDYEDDGKNKTSYYLFTQVLLPNMPEDTQGYLIKTTYYDDNDTRIGQSVDSLSSVTQYMVNPDDEVSVGSYDSFKKPDIDHVVVEIVKNNNVIDNDTYMVDRGSIEFL